MRTSLLPSQLSQGSLNTGRNSDFVILSSLLIVSFLIQTTALAFVICLKLKLAFLVRTTVTNPIPEFPIARFPCLQNHLHMIRMELTISLPGHHLSLATEPHSYSHPCSKCQHMSYLPPYPLDHIFCPLPGQRCLLEPHVIHGQLDE